MKGLKTVYNCSTCGYVSPKWMGKCPQCGAWNSFIEDVIDTSPKDENGDYDYECLEALDVPLINQNLLDLFAGKEVQLPSYDFHTSTPYFEEHKKMKLKENEIKLKSYTDTVPNDLLNSNNSYKKI